MGCPPGTPIVVLSALRSRSRSISASRQRSSLAAADHALAEAGAAAFSTPQFRVYSHTDVIGVELGGALKTYRARRGHPRGLGLASTPGAMITRGLAEITRLGGARAQPMTFAGLAGLGT